MSYDLKRAVDKAIKEIEKVAKSLKGKGMVKVGLPANANPYPDGTPVVMVGAVHEFGSPSQNIPQRSFLRSTINENSDKYEGMIKKLTKKIVDGEMDQNHALGLLGLQMQGDVVEKISNGVPPALKYREGTPLYDTGHMAQSITFEVGSE